MVCLFFYLFFFFLDNIGLYINTVVLEDVETHQVGNKICIFNPLRLREMIPADGAPVPPVTLRMNVNPVCLESHFAYLRPSFMKCVCLRLCMCVCVCCWVCVVSVHLITTWEEESVDERIHTLADRRRVISLMNGAFDQDLNGLLCRLGAYQLCTFIINLSYIRKCIWERELRGDATQCETLITLWDWMWLRRRIWWWRITLSYTSAAAKLRFSAIQWGAAPLRWTTLRGHWG